MKLTYIANIRLPTEKAHGIQIMKMCEAFSKYGLPQVATTDSHGLIHEELTYKIRKCVFKVYNTLGFGYKESAYQKALEQEFKKEGLRFEPQKRLPIHYEGKKVGDYVPDFLVENRVIIEIKSSKFLTKNDKVQVFYYLKGSDYKLALLVNFGAPKLQIERLVWFSPNEYQKNHKNQRESVADNQWKSVEVELVVPRRFNKIKQDPFEYYGIEPRISPDNNPRESAVKNQRKSAPFKITKLPCLDLVCFGKIGFFIQSLSFAKMAVFYALFKGADIIYSRDELPLFFLSFFKNNLVWEAHGGRYNFAVKRILKKCRKITCITQGLKNFYVNRGAEAEKILVAPDGVDLEKFSIHDSKFVVREKIGLPQDKILVGYVGMLRTAGVEKGINTAIEAMKFLDRNVSFFLVGGNEEDIGYYKNLSKNFGLEGQVFFTGRVRHDLVPQYLRAFDVLVAPYPDNEHYKFYMSPLKIFEYMASGRPIVASGLPSLREILNENSSVLVKPGSPEHLAEGIKAIFKDSQLSDRISKNARLDAQNYTWQKRAERIVNFITMAKI